MFKFLIALAMLACSSFASAKTVTIGVSEVLSYSNLKGFTDGIVRLTNPKAYDFFFDAENRGVSANNAKVVCSMLQMDYLEHGVDFLYGQFKVISFEVDEQGELSEPYFRGNGGDQYQAVLKTVMCKPKK